MDYPDSGKVIFNEGVAITYRLDEIQKQITLTSLNPAAMNPMYNTFNYKLWLQWLIALQREISADLKPEETVYADDLKNSIIEFEKKFPVYKMIKLKVHPYTERPKLDRVALDIIIKKLNEYGTHLNLLKKKKGYGNPTADDPATAMLR